MCISFIVRERNNIVKSVRWDATDFNLRLNKRKSISY